MVLTFKKLKRKSERLKEKRFEIQSNVKYYYIFLLGKYYYILQWNHALKVYPHIKKGRTSNKNKMKFLSRKTWTLHYLIVHLRHNLSYLPNLFNLIFFALSLESYCSCIYTHTQHTCNSLPCVINSSLLTNKNLF